MHQVPRAKSEGKRFVSRWTTTLRGAFADGHLSAIERSLALHVALVDTPRSANSSLAKAMTTVLSSNLTKSESCVEKTRNSKSNSVMLAQSAPPTMTTMLNLRINLVQNRRLAQLQQDNDASERPNESTTSILGPQGLLTLCLTLVSLCITWSATY